MIFSAAALSVGSAHSSPSELHSANEKIKTKKTSATDIEKLLKYERWANFLRVRSDYEKVSPKELKHFCGIRPEMARLALNPLKAELDSELARVVRKTSHLTPPPSNLGETQWLHCKKECTCGVLSNLFDQFANTELKDSDSEIRIKLNEIANSLSSEEARKCALNLASPCKEKEFKALLKAAQELSKAHSLAK